MQAIRQTGSGVVMLVKGANLTDILKQAIRAGYGKLPAVWCLKLYLRRN